MKEPRRSLEASMTPFQAFTYLLSRGALLFAAVWGARYVNMLFDKVHGIEEHKKPASN